jgi:hypothetical protein
MKRFPVRPKKAAKTSATPSRVGKVAFIDTITNSAPALGELVRLADLMSEGKHHLFLLAFSPRVRAEMTRAARETETRVPVLPKWEPTERHLSADRKTKDGIVAAATEASMADHARKAVLSEGDWLPFAQIAERAGFSASDQSDQPDTWNKDGLIFAINYRNVDYVPGYGLDPTTFRPIKALAPVLEVFQGKKDAWGLAYWFASANSFLGGRRPQDLLLTAPAEVLAAAKDEMAGVVHG